MLERSIFFICKAKLKAVTFVQLDKDTAFFKLYQLLIYETFDTTSFEEFF